MNNRVLSVDCGSSHSLALVRTEEGNTLVVSWGRGEDGQLGHGDPDEKVVPHAIYQLIQAKISDIYCGAEYSVAVSREDMKIYTWGWGDFGRLGHSNCNDVFLPSPIESLSGVKIQSVSCGDTHTLVITDGGKVMSFGRNQNGQLGIGTIDDSYQPREVSSLNQEFVTAISCGAEHSICCTKEGKVFSWGWGRYGNIGDGETIDRHTPVLVKGLDGVKIEKVACGWRHSIAIDRSGAVYSWGWSKYGQLGHGDQLDQLIPTKIKSLEDKKVTLVAGGWRHSLACTDTGLLYSWGWNKFGQLGLGHNDDTHTPCEVKLSDNDKIENIASGWRHTLAISKSGKCFAWGRGVNGQLGTGSTTDSNVPIEIKELGSETLSIRDLISKSHPVVMHSIPPSERYALVPDPTLHSHTVPDADFQETKKPRHD